MAAGKVSHRTSVSVSPPLRSNLGSHSSFVAYNQPPPQPARQPPARQYTPPYTPVQPPIQSSFCLCHLDCLSLFIPILDEPRPLAAPTIPATGWPPGYTPPSQPQAQPPPMVPSPSFNAPYQGYEGQSYSHNPAGAPYQPVSMEFPMNLGSGNSYLGPYTPPNM